MNTVRILICATFALLIAALVHSYSTKGDSKEKSLSDLQEEYEKVKLENKIKRERAAATPVAYGQYGAPAPYTPTPQPAFVNPLAQVNPQAPVVTPVPALSAYPIAEAALTKIDALEAENAKLKAKQTEQDAENDMLAEEADVIKNELTDQNRSKPRQEGARAAVIAQALVMARVQIYDDNSGIIILDLVRAQNLTTGQILGIRRGEAGGIIGRIKLGRIESSELGYADPIAESFFGGPVDIKVGDEIIVIP